MKKRFCVRSINSGQPKETVAALIETMPDVFPVFQSVSVAVL
jgi:hypothetical protein